MFWSATRMIERWWLICGPDTLGVPPMEGNIGPCRGNPRVNAIPVTPVMDTQLDELTIRDVLIPLKVNLLRLLKAKVLAKKKEYWYEIYLASFVILHNAERVLDHIMDFSRRFGVMVSFQDYFTFEMLMNHPHSLKRSRTTRLPSVMRTITPVKPYFPTSISRPVAPLHCRWIGLALSRITR
jgi:hypothetical protein